MDKFLEALVLLFDMLRVDVDTSPWSKADINDRLTTQATMRPLERRVGCSRTSNFLLYSSCIEKGRVTHALCAKKSFRCSV